MDYDVTSEVEGDEIEEVEDEDVLEISMEEFETLGDEIQRTVVERDDILACIDGKPMTARGVAKELGVEKYATVYGALTRAKKAGLVVSKAKGKNRYWIKNPNPPEAEE